MKQLKDLAKALLSVITTENSDKEGFIREVMQAFMNAMRYFTGLSVISLTDEHWISRERMITATTLLLVT